MVPLAENDDSKFVIFMKLIIGLATAFMIIIMSIGSAKNALSTKIKKIGFGKE